MTESFKQISDRLLNSSSYKHIDEVEWDIEKLVKIYHELEQENKELLGALRGLFYDVFFKKDNQNTAVVDTIWHNTMTTSFDQFSEYLDLPIENWADMDEIETVLSAKIKKEGEG